MNNLKNKRKDQSYSVFLKHMGDEQEETSRFAKTLLNLVLVICVLVLFFFFFINDEKTVEQLFGKDNFISKKLVEFVQSKAHKQRTQFKLSFMPRRQNILLLGVDSNGLSLSPWKETRSDTIILFNIDSKTHSVNVVSIPRDSKVYLADGHGVQKINAAYALGGIKTTIQTVEETLGVKIDRYIVLSNKAVEKLVDTVGGIPIYVEKRMNYDDYSGHLHVHLKKGFNILDGTNAVAYLRFRHDGLGDIGRTQRQQWFLRSLLRKIQTPEVIAKIPEMINIATSYVKTDLSLYEMSQYAVLAKNLDMSKTEVATLPGAPNKKGSISYWILDPKKTQEVVNRLIYRDESKIINKKFIAGIMYSHNKRQEAMNLKSQLTQLGFEVNCISGGHLPHSQFVANSSSVTNKFFNWLRNRVPEINNNQFVYDPNRYYCPNSDFVVILSGK